jgi:tetratricopeptide (TPR) repeat protein
MRKLKGVRDLEVAAILIDLAATHMWQDDSAGAETAAREAVSIFSGSVSDIYPDRVLADLQLADVLISNGFFDEASGLYERAISAQRRLYGGTSKHVAESLGTLATIRLAQNRPADAERIAREALSANYSLGLQQQSTTGYLKTILANALMTSSKYRDAEAELQEALSIFSKSQSADHQYIASAEYFLGEVYLATGRLSEAKSVLVASMNRLQRSQSSTWRSARSASALGEIEYRQGNLEAAEQHLTDSYHVLSTAKGVDSESIRKARERVTRFYKDLGQVDKLNDLLRARAQTAAIAR